MFQFFFIIFYSIFSNKFSIFSYVLGTFNIFYHCLLYPYRLLVENSEKPFSFLSSDPFHSHTLLATAIFEGFFFRSSHFQLSKVTELVEDIELLSRSIHILASPFRPLCRRLKAALTAKRKNTVTRKRLKKGQ